MIDIGKRFDDVARKYDTPDKLERARCIVDTLMEKIPVKKEWKVLDVGIGTGNTAVYLSPHVKEIVGTDLSKGMLDVLEEKKSRLKIKNIKTYKKDIFKEDIPEKDFDIIFNSMTMHHVEDPLKAVKRFKELLKKGGYVVIVDLYKEDGTFHSDNTDVKHFGFDFEEVRRWYKEAGLDTVFIENIYTIEKEREGIKREYPVFMAIGKSST